MRDNSGQFCRAYTRSVVAMPNVTYLNKSISMHGYVLSRTIKHFNCWKSALQPVVMFRSMKLTEEICSKQ